MSFKLVAEVALDPPAELLTREVFGNISSTGKTAFYLVAAVALAVFALGVYRRVKVWRTGGASKTKIDWGAALRNWLRDALAQRRFRTRQLASLAHRMLFLGFVILFIGTLLIAVEHTLAGMLGREASNPLFHKGLYFAIYEVTLDAAGVAFLLGCAWLLCRRLAGSSSNGQRSSDVPVLVILLAIGVTGYLVEGLRIIHAQTPLPGLSPIGYIVSQMLVVVGVTDDLAGFWHRLLWWGHAVLALGFIAAFPYTRLLHAIAGSLNLALQDRQLGALTEVSIEEVEETGTLGLGAQSDLSWRQMVELDACVSCGRCQDVCPAYEAGKPLSPRDVIQDLVGYVQAGGEAGDKSLHGDTISNETLWSCTTCNQCAFVCPLGVSPVQFITEMRRNQIMEGTLRGSPATALQKTQRTGNPWGLPVTERMKWAEGLTVPTVDQCPDFEILYWIGCAATFDTRLQKVARSVVQLLQAADVKFAVLGKAEKCTGEAARRMGDELLFQELAMSNIETFKKHKVRRIVSHCPHCVNSLRKDYPQLDGEYEVLHHSQLLATLVKEGRLRGASQPGEAQPSITYHDPCYLARSLNTTDEPRAVLGAVVGNSLPVIELPRNGCDTACCGGGGGRMWFDDPPEERIGSNRVDEIVDSGAQVVAVACPFCMTMVSDGLATRKSDMKAKDISEVLLDALQDSPGSP